MVAEPPHLVFSFGLDVQLEGVGAGLPVVTKHEVLPDHDPQLVADLIELVGLVVAATPVSDGVHVGFFCRLQDAAIISGRYAIREAVERNHVRALGKNRNAVDHQLKRSAPLVQLATKLDGSQANLGFSRVSVRRSRARTQLRREVIKRLFAIACGVPKHWLTDLDWQIDHVSAWVHSDQTAD
jgi:hypothetical protein